jgi:uncharacterized small protein (DUF1192 family)
MPPDQPERSMTIPYQDTTRHLDAGMCSRHGRMQRQPSMLPARKPAPVGRKPPATPLGNPRHELFAQELAKGRTPEEAYAESGYRPHRQNAHRLMTNDDIRARIAELQTEAAERTVTTVEDIVRQLDEDRALAYRRGSASAAVQATMGKAKVLGLIVDRQDVSIAGDVALQALTDEELDRRIAVLQAELAAAGALVEVVPTVPALEAGANGGA